jgi:hypothetical protein
MKNLLISIALLSCMIGCKKKKEWNVVRYKVGSTAYYSAGPYTQAIGDGNTKCTVVNNLQSFSGYDESSNTICRLRLQLKVLGKQDSDSAIESSNWFLYGDSIPASIYIKRHTPETNGSYSTRDYKCGFKTATYTILQDTPDFIEGTFEGKLYTNPKDPMLATTYSLQITDGYFCIPKTK